MSQNLPLRTQRQADLQQFLRRFQQDVDYGEALLDFLRSSKADVYRAEPQGARVWHLFVVVPDRLQKLFDIELEVLCVATPFDRLEPRIANAIRDAVMTNPRVDSSFVMVASNDPEAEAMLRQRGELAVLCVTAEKLASGDYNAQGFAQMLTRVLALTDRFDVTSPVSAPGSFFGRLADVQAVRAAIAQRQHVGIFGLRKAGKTSLLNRVGSLLREELTPVTHLDLNSVVGSPDLLRGQLVQALVRVVQDRGGLTPKTKVLGQQGQIREDVRMDLVWLDDVTRVLDIIGANCVLILDEIDQAVPASFDRDGGLLAVLTQLRGLVQSRQATGQSSLTLLTAGVDPALFEKSAWDGRANPLYQFSSVRYLAPLTRDEMPTMVRTLGRRSGLEFDAYTLMDLLFGEYGGHPLLTRQACSYVHLHRGADTLPYRVSEEEVRVAIAVRGPGTPRQHLIDIVGDFTQWFPNEAELMRLLLSSAAEDRELAELTLADNPDALVHAVAYGLLTTERRPRMNGLLALR